MTTEEYLEVHEQAATLEMLSQEMSICPLQLFENEVDSRNPHAVASLLVPITL